MLSPEQMTYHSNCHLPGEQIGINNIKVVSTRLLEERWLIFLP